MSVLTSPWSGPLTPGAGGGGVGAPPARTIYGSAYLGVEPGILYEQPESALSEASDGLVTGRMVYLCRRESLLALWPKALSAHPDYPTLLRDSIEGVHSEGEISQLTVLYKGLLEPEGPRTYELLVPTNAEPLESHWKFKDLSRKDLNYIEDYLQNPKQGILNSGVPSIFDLSEDGYELLIRKLRGQLDYLAPGVTWRESWLTRTAATELTKPGTIQDPNEGGGANIPGYLPAPTIEGHDWLYVGLAQPAREGGAFRRSRDWRLSARGGWDTYIYSAENL